MESPMMRPDNKRRVEKKKVLRLKSLQSHCIQRCPFTIRTDMISTNIDIKSKYYGLAGNGLYRVIRQVHPGQSGHVSSIPVRSGVIGVLQMGVRPQICPLHYNGLCQIRPIRSLSPAFTSQNKGLAMDGPLAKPDEYFLCRQRAA